MREEDNLVNMAEHLWPDGHTGIANQSFESVVFNPVSAYAKL
jgi:hypothetical protein